MSYFDGKYKLLIIDKPYVIITYEGSQMKDIGFKLKLLMIQKK